VEIGEDGIAEQVDYDAALPVLLPRDFLAAPQQFLHHLLDENHQP
jgi:TolA-binding protein